MNRLLLKKVFERWNAELIFAENGQQAVDKVVSACFDLILMDIHMPILDGYDASKVIRKLPNGENVHIIALTASVSNDVDIKIKEAGIDDYLYKPFNAKELYHKIQNNLHHKLSKTNVA